MQNSLIVPPCETRWVFADPLVQRIPFGLLSKGGYVETGELWGYFPQSYPAGGLVNASMALSRRWEDVL